MQLHMAPPPKDPIPRRPHPWKAHPWKGPTLDSVLCCPLKFLVILFLNLCFVSEVDGTAEHMREPLPLFLSAVTSLAQSGHPAREHSIEVDMRCSVKLKVSHIYEHPCFPYPYLQTRTLNTERRQRPSSNNQARFSLVIFLWCLC